MPLGLSGVLCRQPVNWVGIVAQCWEQGEQNMAESADLPPGWEARRLLRAARAGTLATVTGGQPFASLVTPACDRDLSVLLLLSALSEHTRHLGADPRCALMVAGAPEDVNPQTAPRLTLTGLAERCDDAAAKARWLAIHPYAVLYADFADFALWRIRPAAALFVGGFARARRLRHAELLPDATAVAAVADAEAGIRAHCNADHADVLAAIAGTAGAWRMVAVDVDGCDLACEERTRRVSWRQPVDGAAGIRAELVQLVRTTRAG